MFEELLNSSISETTFTIQYIGEVAATSILMGFVISLVYIKTNKKNGFTSGFAAALIMLPFIISIIILLVDNNIARAFSLAGAFALIRFRSALGDPRDMSYVLFTMAIGLACGTGFIAYGAVITLILCVLMIALNVSGYGKQKGTSMNLRLTVRDDQDYEKAYEDIFLKYANFWKLDHINTGKVGKHPELFYKIHLKESADKKKFIDELSIRNGNLYISLSHADYDEKIYS